MKNPYMKRQLISFITLCFPLCIHAQYVSEVWNPDNGDGTYTNPVLSLLLDQAEEFPKDAAHE